MYAQPWPVAPRDSDFDSYLAVMPEASVRMFRRFVDMARTSGPITSELQNGPVVLRGTLVVFSRRSVFSITGLGATST